MEAVTWIIKRWNIILIFFLVVSVYLLFRSPEEEDLKPVQKPVYIDAEWLPSQDNLQKYGAFAKQWAEEAGQIIKEAFHYKYKNYEYKGGVNDLVTSTDKGVELLIKERVTDHFPSHSFLGEEGAEELQAGLTSSPTWVVDPLDGTTNFVHRIPYVAVSIALAIQGTVVVGVVHNPITSDTYVATLGGGAFKNGKRISTSSTTSLEESLVSFGFGYDKHDLSNQLSSLESVMSECRGVRRFGAASLDLCMVAEGTLDIYYETSIRTWDYAAGALILSEAGGAVSNLDGAAFSLGTSQIAVAANKDLLSKFLKLF